MKKENKSGTRRKESHQNTPHSCFAIAEKVYSKTVHRSKYLFHVFVFLSSLTKTSVTIHAHSVNASLFLPMSILTNNCVISFVDIIPFLYYTFDILRLQYNICLLLKRTKKYFRKSNRPVHSISSSSVILFIELHKLLINIIKFYDVDDHQSKCRIRYCRNRTKGLKC